MTHSRTSPLYIVVRRIVAPSLVAGGLFFVYHSFLAHAVRAYGLNLGAVLVDRHFVPLYAEIDPRLGVWLVPALVVLGLFVLFYRRQLVQDRGPVTRLLPLAYLLFVLIGISVAQIDGHRDSDVGSVPAFMEPFTRTSAEYYGDVPVIDRLGLRSFLRDYAKPELFDTLSTHSRTHPPGGVVFLWIVSRIFGYGLLSVSLAVILLAALSVFPMALLARDLHGESVARYALALFLVTPNVVMFSTTSMDGVFATFLILTLFLSNRAMQAANWMRWALLTGLCLALSAFMTYSTVFLLLYIAIFTILSVARRQLEWRRTLPILTSAAGAFVAVYLVLYLFTGFNPVDAFDAAVQKDQRGMGTGYETIGRYVQLSVANLVVFFTGCGVALSVVWGQAVWKSAGRWRSMRPTDAYVLAFSAALVIIAFSTLFTMEVERVWIFMAPLVVLPVASFLHGMTERNRSPVALHWVVGLLIGQLVLFEVALYTYW